MSHRARRQQESQAVVHLHHPLGYARTLAHRGLGRGTWHAQQRKFISGYNFHIKLNGLISAMPRCRAWSRKSLTPRG